MRAREEYDDAALYVQDQLRSRRRRIRLIILAVVLAVLAAIAWFLAFFRVQYVTVEGSTHYTDEEMEEYVLTGFLGDNTVALRLRQGRTVEWNIPFVETLDVEITAHNAVHITVYEKSLAGYVRYLGNYMYFDRDGIVVESSAEKVGGVSEVTGLSFDHIIVNEALPVEDADIFTRILQTTQLLDKYDLTADRIYVGTKDEISIYFDQICVYLGEDENMDEKISNLSKILPSLEGKSGSIDLADYTTDTNFITFTEQ